MKSIYIFGIGKGKGYLERCLLENVYVCGYIDNYKAENMLFFEGKRVVRQNELFEQYDYIVITLMQYKDIKKALLEDGIAEEKIISFFDFEDASDDKNWLVIDPYKWRAELMWKHYNEIVIPTIDNMGYELYCDSQCVIKNNPKIINVKDTVDILYKEKKCLARFGDGEFELISGRVRAKFQDVNSELSKRLKEVLNSREKNLLIAIADNYGSLERYTEEAARDIRMYLTKEVRKEHMELLDLKRQYYDAYLSRPYIMFRDKENTKSKFDQIKRIWNKTDVLVVEGEYTRFGVGNDLLNNAKSIKRIVVPDNNAFEKYEKIKSSAFKYGRNKLVLCIMGPTATVLAYDLAKEDYWAIDIGQLDTEYEWFLRGVDKRCELEYKNVSEVIRYEKFNTDYKEKYWEAYKNEIIEKIL